MGNRIDFSKFDAGGSLCLNSRLTRLDTMLIWAMVSFSNDEEEIREAWNETTKDLRTGEASGEIPS